MLDEGEPGKGVLFPAVINVGWMRELFWDGRVVGVEDQARQPVTNPIEMGMGELEEAMDRVRDIPGYKGYFEKAFGTDNPMTVENAAKAVAAYERTLITPNSAYDRYVKGDKKALSEQQLRGMNSFASVGCTACHSGAAFNGPTMSPGSGFFMKFPTFTDNDYVKQYNLTEDTGRFTVTKNDADKHMWKVPTVRNVALTAPYFHNGSVATLDEAVRVMARVQLNQDLTDGQVADIVAFLSALTGEFPEQSMPHLPPTPGRSIIK